MAVCIYCGRDKRHSEFTLEHVIPQSLGGAYAPDLLKLRNVCKRCNSDLGLFVDAAFEKNWVVSNTMQQSARASFDPDNPTGLPLICMGASQLNVPGMTEDEVCECWLGPFGEQVYWIRPREDNLYWYSGGNPRTTKSIATRAYFMFSERSIKNPKITWLSFRDAFEGRKKVRKIMCTTVQGADPQDIGFHTPDTLDESRIVFFRSLTAQSNSRKNSISLFLDFDLRFASKLALGVGYALFGEKIHGSSYTEELRKGLWHKPGESLPDILGTGVYDENRDADFARRMGYKNAVSVVVIPSGNAIAVNLNVGTAMSFCVMFADTNCLSHEDIEKVRNGIVIVLFKYLRRGVSLSLLEYVSHKLGNVMHPGLSEIDSRIEQCMRYMKSL
jgi:hypothetical protein